MQPLCRYAERGAPPVQDFVPLIGVVIVFGALIVFMGRKRSPRTRNRYARWNARVKR